MLTATLLCLAQAPLVASSIPAPSSHLAWGDLDGDGLDDLVLVGVDRPGLVLRNAGDGGFEDVGATFLAGPLPAARGALVADLDADGRPELVVIDAEGALRHYRNVEGTSLEEVVHAGELGELRGVETARVLDYDRDGRVDLLLDGERADIWRAGEGGAFTRVELASRQPAAIGALASGPLGAGAANARGAASADVAPGAERDGSERLAPATPGGTSSMTTVSGATISGRTLETAPAGMGLGQEYCLPSIQDQATAMCLTASSVPMLGMLMPLSLDFNLDGAGRIGAGTTTPLARMHVQDSSEPAAIRGESTSAVGVVGVGTTGIYGTSFAPNGIALHGFASDATSSNIGLWGQTASPTGTGLLGTGGASGAIGTTAVAGGRGVTGESTATGGSGVGVRGESAGDAGTGVVGVTTSPSGATVGVYGETASFEGLAVSGLATSASGMTIGVRGESASASGLGMRGRASSTTGAATGVLGESYSVDGTGVLGFAQSLTGTTKGVEGIVWSEDGTAVVGSASSSLGSPTGVRGESAGAAGTGVLGLTTSASGTTTGVRGESSSSAGIGVSGIADSATGATFGVHGEAASDDGVGVEGVATSASGDTIGVRGETLSVTGYGIVGENNHPTPSGSSAGGVIGRSRLRGVIGDATGNDTSSAIGVVGRTASPTGKGVFGTALSGTAGIGVDGAGYTGVRGRHVGTTGTGPGVYGETASNTDGSVAVLGVATSSSAATTVGVEGQSSSPLGAGVRGQTDATSGDPAGVRGEAMGTIGLGVHGISSSYRGVLGEGRYGVVGQGTSPGGGAEAYGGLFSATASTLNNYGLQSTATGGFRAYGIVASASGAAMNYAGYFDGDVEITGSISKGAGTFKIDHPLDPTNKYLYHSFVESPDMMNVYNGNVVLGTDGGAWVELPEYFEALNRDFRYQLTCVGSFAPVYVAARIDGNRFRIAGGEAGIEVSWQVTGVRQDAYAEANRVQVEVVKTGEERGKYLHPEAHGLDAELSIGRAVHGQPEHHAQRGEALAPEPRSVEALPEARPVDHPVRASVERPQVPVPASPEPATGSRRSAVRPSGGRVGATGAATDEARTATEARGSGR